MNSLKSHQIHRPKHLAKTTEPLSTNAATRLISEAAHDVRAPLTTIRESIRLVRDGDLGEVNSAQLECLDAAMTQCDCVDQLIGEMVKLDRLKSGLPRVQRRWITVPDIRDSVDKTLCPWALPREITVVWDGADNPNLKLYVDDASLRRLIVNIAANAIRATRQGECVLIQVRPQSDCVRFAVIDQGKGMTPSELQSISSRQVSHSGGEGLGLMICRQLAALNFSSLRLRSRVGSGTEVSFDVPSGGPSQVVSCWTRWRERFVKHGNDGTAIDQQKGSTRSYVTELVYDRSAPTSPNQVALGNVTLGATMSRQAADQFDMAFQYQLRLFDFAYRVSKRRWIWALDVTETGLNDRIKDLNDCITRQIESLRADWSRGTIINFNRRKITALLSDCLIRESLAALTVNTVDANQVRLGTPPIQPSSVAAKRLDEELKRLTGKLRSQTESLRRQASELAPK